MFLSFRSRGPQPTPIELTATQISILEQIVRGQTNPQNLVRRAKIILTINEGHNNSQTASKLELNRETIRLWRDRWFEVASVLLVAEAEGISDQELMLLVKVVLADAPRSGVPATFTPEQIVQIVAVACENPQDSDRPISHWTSWELADEVIKRNIVTTISPRSVGRFLDEADLKPHLHQYWLNSKPDDPEIFAQEVNTVCDVYHQAPQLHQEGASIVSTDEKTSIQALERKHPTKPMKPGQVALQEFEYIRHGTLCLMVNFEVATGKIIAPTIGPTRTEIDFANHIEQTIATNPEGKWIIVVDQLNTHQSESLVKLVIRLDDLDLDADTVGVKGKSGILKSMATRKIFLEEDSHRIQIVYTPKHTSWLNQVEIWFSILVRKLLRRASFSSLEDLRQRILDFIDYFNKTMAKPFKWTYKGRPLTV
jgi:transposase